MGEREGDGTYHVVYADEGFVECGCERARSVTAYAQAAWDACGMSERAHTQKNATYLVPV